MFCISKKRVEFLVINLVVFLFILSGLIFFFQGCGGGGSGSSAGGSSEVASDKDILSKTGSIIDELESGLSSEDEEIYREMENYVSLYDLNKSTALFLRKPAEESEDDFTAEPENLSQLYRMVGIMAFLQGSSKGALWFSLKAVLEDSENSANLTQAGSILNHMERYDDAEMFLKKAVEENEENDAALISLGYTANAKGDNNAAAEYLKKAAQLNPESKVVQKNLFELFLQNEEQVNQIRNQVYTKFKLELLQASALNSNSEILNFIQEKQSEAADTANEALMIELPQNIDPDFYQDYLAVMDKYSEKMEKIDDQRTDDVNLFNDYFYDENEKLYQDIVSQGCTTPESSCQCMRNWVSGQYDILRNEVYSMIYQVSKEYINSAANTMILWDTEINSLIFDHYSTLSEEELLWAYNHLYKNLEMHSIEVAMGYSTILNAQYTIETYVQTNYQVSQQACEAIQEALDDLANRKAELEEERQRQIRAKAEAEIRRRLEEKESSLSFDACLDSIGCLGLNGDTIGIKIGGPLFAQFTVDTSSFNIGVRAGLGLSDPTGNIAGIDISVGGNISSSGTTFNVVSTQSGSFGIINQKAVLYNSSFNW